MNLIREGRLLVATHNKGKLAEFRTLLEPAGIEVVRTLNDHGIETFPQDYIFFILGRM